MNTQSSDTVLTVVNPEGVAYTLQPAGLVSRVLAYAIDNIIVSVFYFGLLVFAAIYQDMFGIWIYLLIDFAVRWFYFSAWEIFSKGSTPGKKALGLRVVNGDGSPVSPGPSFLRNLLRAADTFLGLSLIGVFCLMLSPGFRRIGDWGASTLVISVNKPRKGLLRGHNLPDSIPAVKAAVPLKGEEKKLLIEFARRYNDFGPARANEIASALAPLLTENGAVPGDSGAYVAGLGRTFIGEDLPS